MGSQHKSVVDLQIRDDAVAVVRIERPEVKNALNRAMREQLAEIFRALAGNDRVRAIVLTGGEQCFVAGADIREFAGLDCECKGVWRAEVDSDLWLPAPMGTGGNRRGSSVDLARAP